MSFDLHGKIALVTGGNRGIGKEIVTQLLDEGVAKVYVAVRQPASANELVSTYGDRVVPVELDVTKPETIAAAADVAQDVQVLVNNAGVLKTASPLSDDVFEALDFEIDVNVKGLIRVARAFAPLLKKNGGGVLVQLNSIASLRSFADFSTYCASKAASYSMTQSLRDALQEQGTQVVSVHPGPIATEMADHAGLSEMAEPPSVVAEGIVAAIKSGDFHVFPDSMARDLWQSYAPFAQAVVEQKGAEE